MNSKEVILTIVLILAVSLVFKSISLLIERIKKKRKAKHFEKRMASFSHISTMAATAIADNKLDEKEKNLLLSIAKREGLSDQDLGLILSGRFTANEMPKDDKTKRRYLKDLVTMMAADGNISNEEFNICTKTAVEYGFSEDIIKEIMDETLGDSYSIPAGISHATKQDEPSAKNGQEVKNKADVNSTAPDLATTHSVVWMAHCINLPFLSQGKNMEINYSILSLLNDYVNAVKTGNEGGASEIANTIQGLMKEKFGNQINNPMAKALMLDFKICALSKDLLDMYKMVIEGKRDEDVLSGKGSIRRILKYSIELGSPAKTLDTLTDYFVNNAWFDDMPEQEEWHKLALECMMVTGNGELGSQILSLLQGEGGIRDDEKEELLNHAKTFRSQTDVSWM